MRPGRRWIWVGGVVAAVLALAVLVAAGAWAWTERQMRRPFAGWTGPAVDMVLESGLDAGTVLDRLAQAGVIQNPQLARAWLAWRGGGERLQAGEYRFQSPASVLEVLERLERGDVLRNPITFPEGVSRIEMAEGLTEAGFGPYEAIVAAFDDPALIADLDAQAKDLEGYLFPDTYNFTRGESPARIAEAMVRRFREVVGMQFAEQAQRAGLTVRGAVTLASMIEKETALSEERTRVSRVFHNRLARGMRLECDPTVMYGLARAGKPVRRLTLSNLRFESPWNTYVVDGLPCGPIGNPGRGSLMAAIRPSVGQDLYFVAAPEGGHRFSANYDDHQRAVALWRSYLDSSR